MPASSRRSQDTTIYETLPRFTRDSVLLRYFGFGQSRNGAEMEMMSDWNSVAGGIVSSGFGPPNEITVLFDDRMLTFPMSPAATLTDLAQRLTEEGRPREQMLSVTIKLGEPIGIRRRFRQPSRCENADLFAAPEAAWANGSKPGE
jgi:hypothetical protein